MKKLNATPIIAALIVGGLLIISLINVFFRGQQSMSFLITRDLAVLKEKFEAIHKDCVILSFDYQKNPINFLNVGSFVGSEVGPMNLKHPERWKGPYLPDNPTMQGLEYQIVYTYDGYFITPGDGVELPNGKTIGKEIILDEDADILEMMEDKDALMFDNKAMAVPLPLGLTGEQMTVISIED